MAQASAENLSIQGLLKRREWPQCHRERSWQVRRSRPCQKSKAPDYKVGESQGEGKPHLDDRKRGIRAEASRGKSGLHSEERQVSRKKARARKEGLLRRSRRKHERVSGRKNLFKKICKVLVSLQGWPNLKWERRSGDEKPAHKMKE